MTGSATEPTRTDPRRVPTERTEPWQHELAARTRVRGLLQDLPAGFIVFEALELPRPTIATVDHLVIGPRNVWAVTTHVSSEPITFGRGRNADTLWAGGTSLRTVLEAADWEAAALADHIGFAVEPVICIVAPGLPEPAFDFYGIRITEPSALVRQVATSTADFVDVTAVADAVRRSFGAEPVTSSAPPTLGAPVHPPTLRPTSQRRHRTLGARLYALRSARAARVGVLVALAAVLVASLPTIVGVWNSVASEGAERITAVIDDDALADGGVDTVPSRGTTDTPTGVRYVLSCPDDGAGWEIEWTWPGPTGPGVVGYTVRTRSGDGATVVHTASVWTDPGAPPPAARVVDPAATEIITQHRAADGGIVATATEMLAAPTTTC
ncbi:MAG: hypothetical protein R8G01_13100 [Ilumatobacteraceae bacterium]|nr:hypothetical protein [Ilumatobacteraceae bacterium]